LNFEEYLQTELRRRRNSCGEWEEGKLNEIKRGIKRDEE